MASIKSRGSEVLAAIISGMIIVSAQGKSWVRPDYDPMGETSAAIALFTAVWLAPTGKIDEKIKDALDKVDREL